MIGLDTTVIIDFFNNKNEAIKVIENTTEPLASTTINYLEIFFGLDFENKKHQMEAKNYETFFNTISTFNLTKENCKEISKMYWNLRKKGKENGKFDCIIASIFLSNGINTIITRNKKHFENIDGINVISY